MLKVLAISTAFERHSQAASRGCLSLGHPAQEVAMDFLPIRPDGMSASSHSQAHLDGPHHLPPLFGPSGASRPGDDLQGHRDVFLENHGSAEGASGSELQNPLLWLWDEPSTQLPLRTPDRRRFPERSPSPSQHTEPASTVVTPASVPAALDCVETPPSASSSSHTDPLRRLRLRGKQPRPAFYTQAETAAEAESVARKRWELKRKARDLFVADHAKSRKDSQDAYAVLRAAGRLNWQASSEQVRSRWIKLAEKALQEVEKSTPETGQVPWLGDCLQPITREQCSVYTKAPGALFTWNGKWMLDQVNWVALCKECADSPELLVELSLIHI